jgi:hypothetical protein
MNYVRHLLIRMLFMVLVLASGPIVAGVKVLDVEIGVTTLEAVKASIKQRGTAEDLGLNRFSGGTVLKVAGHGFGIEGLQEVFFTHDEKKTLVAVVLLMDKGRFDTVHQFLKSKYKTTRQVIPYVGDKYVEFAAHDTTIELDSPHLSFGLEVRYTNNEIAKKAKALQKTEAESKKKMEQSKF